MRPPRAGPLLGFRCPNPDCDEAIGVALAADSRSAACPRCAAELRLKEGALDAKGQLVRCPVCGMEDLWLKKNFRLDHGCAILVVAALLMDATYQLSMPVAVLVDLVLYQFLGDVAVCYRCASEVRHTPTNPAHGAYDLHHATHLDKEIHRAGGAAAFKEWTPGGVATGPAATEAAARPGDPSARPSP